MVATSGYQLGRRLGCIDGESLVGRPSFVMADETRLADDAAYAAGWDDGQLECYEAFLRNPRSWKSTGK